jgi:hypothetical protein
VEATLVRQLGPMAVPRDAVSLDRVAAALRRGETLIEIVAYRADGGGDGAKRYGAFVVDGRRGVSWLDLGEAAAIERGVGDLASVGEGVYGMRRAAAVAGASTFVAPL